MSRWREGRYPLPAWSARILRWGRWVFALALALAVGMLVYSIATGAGRTTIIESVAQIALYVLMLANNQYVLRRHDAAAPKNGL